MGSSFGLVEVEKVSASSAATNPTDLVRLQELVAALAGKASASHSHASAEITDFEGAVADVIGLMVVVDSDSLAWTYEEGPGSLSADVRLKPGGFLLMDADGVYVKTGESGVSLWDHTHDQLHDAATVDGSETLDLEVDGDQVITGSVRLRTTAADGVGLLSVDSEGIYLAAAESGLAPWFHSHDQLHDELTVEDTNSIALELVDGEQVLRAELRRKSGGYLLEDSSGVYVRTGESGLALYEHSHSNATQAEAGFMSPEDKRKLDNYVSLVQAGMAVGYAKHDYLLLNGYVGGRHRWEQNMEVRSVTLTSHAPLSTAGTVTLGLEVGGIILAEIDIPSGIANAEVVNALTLTDVFIGAGEYARWKCTDGAESIDDAPSVIDVSMVVRPAVESVPEVTVNCGGGSVGAFDADAYYDGGAAGTTTHAIDTTGVTSPGQAGVYQTMRYKWYDNAPLNYDITGLAVGINYKVRLHFCEFYWNAIGDVVMNIDVIGSTTAGEAGFDILDETSGVKFKAVIREFTVKADLTGKIRVRLTPLAGNGGYYNLGICGIEVLED